MSRWRKVDVRLWNDEKFRRLSPIPACGQGLWVFLLTNRFTTNVPGLYSAGEAALAEELGWSLQGFRKAFAEVSREGLAQADWKARVVWIPNGLKYDPPSNPNVVKGWRLVLNEIPACDLKTTAIEQLGQWLREGFPASFGEAFTEALGERSTEQYANTRTRAGTGALPGSKDPPVSPAKDAGDFPKGSLRFSKRPRKGDTLAQEVLRAEQDVVTDRARVLWNALEQQPMDEAEMLAFAQARWKSGPANERVVGEALKALQAQGGPRPVKPVEVWQRPEWVPFLAAQEQSIEGLSSAEVTKAFEAFVASHTQGQEVRE